MNRQHFQQLAAVACSMLCAASLVLSTAECAEGAQTKGTDTATPPKPAASTGAANATPTGALRLASHSVKDSGIGTDAFTILVPADWKVEGGITWRHDLSVLVTTAMRFSKPDGSQALELFPMIACTWMDGGITFFPEGSIYLGNEVHRPVSGPQEYVEQIVIPRFRSNVGARVVEHTNLPDVAKLILDSSQEPGMQKRALAERVRLEYTENGKSMQEDVFCTLLYAQSPMMPGATLWCPTQLYSFKAEKGKLDASAGLLQAIVGSVKLNPHWYSGYLQVVQLWRDGQNQAIRNAGELSRYISKINDEISDIHRQAYAAQQASSDRIHSNFSKYVRGVEAYESPLGNTRVELPSGYRDAWVSESGEYLLSNEAGFDPNVGATHTWQRMKEKQ